MTKTRRLPVKDIDAALKAYYGTGYIGNKEIGEMFGTSSSSTINKLKKPVREAEREQNLPVYVPYHVNARIAFEVWGIDVKELERNRKKMHDLNLA